MKYILSIHILICVSTFAWSQARVDITTCAGTSTGIVCVAPSDSTYRLCVKVTPGPCTDKNYTIDWGDNRIEKIKLDTTLTLYHNYDLRTFIRNCSLGEFKVSIFVENATCPNDNKGFRVTFNKNPEAKPAVNSACEGSSLYMTNNSCPTSSDVKFLWEFSDGQTSTSTTPSLSFTDASKTYKVKLTATSHCGTSSNEIQFSLKKLPVADFTATGTAVINQDTVVCLAGGGVITLDGTVSIDETQYGWQISGGRYSFNDKNSTSYSGVTQIKLEEIAVYTITLTVGNSCGSRRITKKIKVVNLPALTLTPQPDVCEEITYQIPNPIAGAEYTLNGKPLNASQPIVLPLATLPYIVSAKISNACGTQLLADTFMVSPFQPVKILTFSNDTTICVSTTGIPLQVNIAGGSWSTTKIEIRNGQAFFVPDTPGDYVVSYSKGVGKCYTIHEVKVKVVGIQVTTISETVCAGTPFVRLKATPSGGTWSSSSCLNCLKGDTLFTAGIVSNQIDILYSISNSIGCKATAAARITFGRPKADFTMVGGCAGSTFQPKNSSSPGTYIWFVNGKSVSTDENPKLTLSAGLQKIWLVVVAGNCSDTLKKDFTIVAPPLPVSFTPSTSTGCAPLNVTFAVTGKPSPDTQYEWDFGNGTTYTGFQPQGQLFDNKNKQDKSYRLTLTAKNSCGLQTDSKDIVVRPKAQAEIGVDSTMLRCTPAQLLFSNRSWGHDKNQSKWIFGDGTTRQTGNDTLYHSFSTRDTVRTFKVKLEISSVCGRDTASVNIQVYPTTVKALYTISKSVVCPGEEVRFKDATVPKPERWIWKFGDGTVSTLPDPVHKFMGEQRSYKVTLIAFTSCGYDSTQLTLKTTDAIAGDFEDVPLACEGSPVQFVNKSNPQLGFVWDFGDGSAPDSLNYSPVHHYSKTGNYVTTLSVYRGTKSCQVVAQKRGIVVVPPVVAAFGFNGDSLFCAPGPVSILNLSQNADTFSWTFGDGRTSDVKNPALPFDPGMYSVKLIASKGGYCADSVERMMAFTVTQCQVDIPSAFTPNGDGYGDRYTFFGNGIIEIDHLLIRNRWGEKVFEMKNVQPGSQQSNESWDGTHNGKPAAADMYVYEAVVIYANKRKSEKLRGNIYLTR